MRDGIINGRNFEDIFQEEGGYSMFGHQGVKCLAIRMRNGGWCGYASVDATHPLYKKEYSDVYCHDIDVCLTYSNHLLGDDLWFFGFDCAHWGEANLNCQEGVYRTKKYVICRIQEMAEALNKAAK